MRKPIVVVCGWMNANAKGVDKYAKVYRELGFEAMLLSSRFSHLFLPPTWIHAKETRALIQQKQNNELVFIPQMISNGGCISWTAMQLQLKQANVKYHVPAMVFDSAPTFPRAIPMFSSQAKLTLDTMTREIQSPLIRKFTQECIRWGWTIVATRWKIARAPDPLERTFDELFASNMRSPKLFLYSSNDNIVQSADVEVAIEQAQANGACVEAINFQESGHVSHLIHSPERYRKSVAEFLKKNKVAA